MTIREEYNKYGFYVVKDAIKVNDYSNLHDALKTCYDESVEKYIAKLTALAKFVDTYRVLMSDEILGWLFIKEPSVSSQPSIHVMCNYLKIPDGYNGTQAHQDWASTQGSLDSQTVWVPLTPTKDNFPIEVIPGSHLRGLLDGKVNGSVLELDVSDEDFVPVECEVGDVIFMSSFLVHRTGKGGDSFRMAASIRYDNPQEQSFMDRNFYSAQKRFVERGIKWRPTAEDMKGVFNVG